MLFISKDYSCWFVHIFVNQYFGLYICKVNVLNIFVDDIYGPLVWNTITSTLNIYDLLPNNKQGSIGSLSLVQCRHTPKQYGYKLCGRKMPNHDRLLLRLLNSVIIQQHLWRRELLAHKESLASFWDLICIYLLHHNSSFHVLSYFVTKQYFHTWEIVNEILCRAGLSSDITCYRFCNIS